MSDVFLSVPLRTPIGRFLGSLASVSAPALAAVTLRGNLEKSGIEPDQIDEVILGQVVMAGVGQAPARQAALAAGLPPAVPALTINKVCGSGLKAVMLADQAIRAGDARAILAGGMESMSQTPFLLPRVRQGWKFGHQTAEDALLKDGLWCAHEDVVMGELAEQTAADYGVSRRAQDEWAALSHKRAIEAQTEGRFRAEVLPVEAGRGKRAVTDDEGPRRETDLESLAGLRPAFRSDGCVTAGNASQLSDGAASLLVSDAEAAERIAGGPVARIAATATSGVPPRELFIAPVPAIRRVLENTGWSVGEVDLFEINEAFAAQLIACQNQLEIPSEKLNVHGGAIALGHPLGASGARILVTLMHALSSRQVRRGVAALCLGGGNAVAIAIERVR